MDSIRLKYCQTALICLILTAAGCASMSRHPRSGYYNNIEKSSAAKFYQEKVISENNRAEQELGLLQKEERDKEYFAKIATRVQLNRLEKSLESDREKKQYFSAKPYLADDEERIYLLTIPSYEDRAKYIQNMKATTSAVHASPELQEIVDSGDIVLGMTKKLVKESWGEPESVEVAGNPVYGNERWRYTRNIASENGGNKEYRLIYFEGGRVAGWEKQ